MTFQYHDYLDDQYGILLPTPLTFALLGFEKSRHHWNKTVLPYLREGIDWLKAPNPRNNNSPVVFYTKSGLLQLCRILNRLDLEPQISAIAPRGGQLVNRPPQSIQWQAEPNEDPVLPYSALTQSVAGQWDETPGGSLVAPAQPHLEQVNPYIPPLPHRESPQQQGIQTMESLASIILTAQNQTADNIHRAHQTAQQPVVTPNVQIKLPSWFDQQDGLVLNLLYLLGIGICLIGFIWMATPQPQPQELYPQSQTQ
jgi:hypothetical protein